MNQYSCCTDQERYPKHEEIQKSRTHRLHEKIYSWNRMYTFFASLRPESRSPADYRGSYRSEADPHKQKFRALIEKCHFSRPQFTIVASLRCRLRRFFVHWDSSCLYPALRAAGYGR